MWYLLQLWLAMRHCPEEPPTGQCILEKIRGIFTWSAGAQEASVCSVMHLYSG